MKQIFKGYIKAVIETDEKNPVVIAELILDNVDLAKNYRVRLTSNRPISLSTDEAVKEARRIRR